MTPITTSTRNERQLAGYGNPSGHYLIGHSCWHKTCLYAQLHLVLSHHIEQVKSKGFVGFNKSRSGTQCSCIHFNPFDTIGVSVTP